MLSFLYYIELFILIVIEMLRMGFELRNPDSKLHHELTICHARPIAGNKVDNKNSINTVLMRNKK